MLLVFILRLAVNEFLSVQVGAVFAPPHVSTCPNVPLLLLKVNPLSMVVDIPDLPSIIPVVPNRAPTLNIPFPSIQNTFFTEKLLTLRSLFKLLVSMVIQVGALLFPLLANICPSFPEFPFILIFPFK